MVQTFIEAHGTYKFFQKLFGNTRKSTYRYTEDILEKYNSLIEYKYIHNNSKRLNQIGTEKSISLMKGLKLGDTINQVRSRFKVSPYVKMYSSKGVRRIILLYKIKLGGQKVKVEAHFYKNQLFFSKCIFSNVSDTVCNELTNHFGEKYGVSNLDFTHKNIVDASNECVKLTTGTEIAVSYIQLNNPFFERMQEKMAVNTNTVELTYATALGV